VDIFGDINKVRKAIEEKYNRKVKELESGSESQVKEAEQGAEREIKALKDKTMSLSEKEAARTYSKVLSEETLKTKRGFEEERERMIDSVFEEVKKKAVKFVHSDAYLDYIKSKMGDTEYSMVIGDSSGYKGKFKAEEFAVDKDIIGLRFKVGEAFYDFTVEELINAKREYLRGLISKSLFGEK
tara:strand:+ start:16586 stop:17137 length:552 start_codon:yes stop_codon:yes gene_type:complete